MPTNDRRTLIASFILNLTNDARTLLIHILQEQFNDDDDNPDDGAAQTRTTAKESNENGTP